MSPPRPAYATPGAACRHGARRPRQWRRARRRFLPRLPRRWPWYLQPRQRPAPSRAHCVDLRELGTQQEHLRGVVDPHQQHDQRACRRKSLRHPTLADTKTDDRLADLEEHRCHDGGRSHVAPRNEGGRHQLIDHREEQGRDADSDGRVQRRQQDFRSRQPAGPATE